MVSADEVLWVVTYVLLVILQTERTFVFGLLNPHHLLVHSRFIF